MDKERVPNNSVMLPFMSVISTITENRLGSLLLPVYFLFSFFSIFFISFPVVDKKFL